MKIWQIKAHFIICVCTVAVLPQEGGLSIWVSTMSNKRGPINCVFVITVLCFLDNSLLDFTKSVDILVSFKSEMWKPTPLSLIIYKMDASDVIFNLYSFPDWGSFVIWWDIRTVIGFFITWRKINIHCEIGCARLSLSWTQMQEILPTGFINKLHYRSSSLIIFSTFSLPPCLSISSLCPLFLRTKQVGAHTRLWQKKRDNRVTLAHHGLWIFTLDGMRAALWRTGGQSVNASVHSCELKVSARFNVANWDFWRSVFHLKVGLRSSRAGC